MTVIQIGCSQRGLPNWFQEIVTGTIIVFAVALDRLRKSTAMKITDLSVLDLRFPTSRDQVGTDAVHTDPDYSAAYVILETDGGLEGHGLTFTIGRGNEVCAAAIHAFRHLVVGRDLRDITSDFGGFWHSLAGESQLRWLGPEKGVLHLALAAVVNALWDLYVKAERQARVEAACGHAPAQLVSCIDFHHITDALTPDEAFSILERFAATKPAREAELLLRRLSRLYDIGGMAGILRR